MTGSLSNSGSNAGASAGLLTEHRLRVADLSQKRETAFEIVVRPAEMAEIASAMGLSELRKLRFEGAVAPLAGKDWSLSGTLGATVVQPCGITLDPVTTRIDEAVQRSFIAGYVEDISPEASETEMPDDETVEPLGDTIDLGAIALEALSLAIPAFPRAKDADLGEMLAAPAGTTPLDDAATKPFAGLAGLRESLENKDK